MYNHRYSELDLLRGLAVLSMIGYHLCFDLAYFHGVNIPIDSLPFSLWAKGTAGMFLGVIGICFTISWSRRGKACLAPTRWGMYLPYLRRGTKILLGGLLISLVTYFVTPDAFIRFGILHLIGVSAFIQPAFVRLGKWNALIGLVIILVSIYLRTLPSFPYLPYLLSSPAFASLDYYPLLPWFGVVLIGMAIGMHLYVPTRKWSGLPVPGHPYTTITTIGRHALLIYFLHQPFLLLLLYLLFPL